MFWFPKGLVHYQYNSDAKNPATAISAFDSANAGIASIPTTLFVTGIDDNILAKAFKTDAAAIQKIKAGLAAKIQGVFSGAYTKGKKTWPRRKPVSQAEKLPKAENYLVGLNIGIGRPRGNSETDGAKDVFHKKIFRFAFVLHQSAFPF
ncbi:hypothetical protein F0562_001571 [Nyssa sinensis]|uniref:Cupin type-1 domain-containing protein n=1 Tax=Nyssa sinensis TaxID=561372 RepID=A0A5J5C7K5_9ASTE|nr:hypothetical protein F0562_001571 [Nyssa sinensis]